MSRTSDTLLLAALGAGAYLAIRKLQGSVAEAVAPYTEPLAEGYVALTSGPGVQTTTKIELPNGQRLELGAVKLGSDFRFTYGGIRYQVTGRNIDGNYDAVLVAT